MAYSVSGFIYDQNNNVIPNCFYQFLFIKVDPSSSSTIWSDIYQSDSNGYYSHDILDGDMLGSEGIFNISDLVLVCCWLGDVTRSISITSCSCWIHEIVNKNQEHIVQNIKLYNIQPPISHFTNLPSVGKVGTSYSIINDSTTDFFIFDSTCNAEFCQLYTYKGETIFPCCEIKESLWDYGNGSETFSGKHDGSRIWTNHGIYNVKLTVKNFAELEDDYTEQITIKYSVYVDFSYLPLPAILEQEVDFTNVSTDVYNRVTKYVWEFYDGSILLPPTNVYEGDHSFSPRYIFTSYPDRCVILKAHWNDGFEDVVTPVTKNIIFQPFASFEKIDTSCAPIYRDNSKAGLPPKTYYWWSVKEYTPFGWKELLYLEGNDAYQIKYHFPNTGTFLIWHKIQDSNLLTDDTTAIYNISECPCKGTTPQPSSGYAFPGGAIPERKRKPVIKVHYKKIKEKEKVKVTLKLVQTENNKNKK